MLAQATAATDVDGRIDRPLAVHLDRDSSRVLPHAVDEVLEREDPVVADSGLGEGEYPREIALLDPELWGTSQLGEQVRRQSLWAQDRARAAVAEALGYVPG